MLAFVKFGKDDQNRTVYRCGNCGATITNAAAVLILEGTGEHSYVNPAGIKCDFMTFSGCENAVAHPELYLEHSWFAGYGWRFLTCSHCFSHLGWRYDAVKTGKMPKIFYGLLVARISGSNKTV